jgi:hypothetical protein
MRRPVWITRVDPRFALAAELDSSFASSLAINALAVVGLFAHVHR